MKKPRKTKRRPASDPTPAEQKSIDTQRALRTAVKRHRDIKQLTRQLAAAMASANSALGVLSYRIAQSAAPELLDGDPLVSTHGQ